MSLEPAGVQAALDRFLALHPKLIDLSLDRLDALLEDLGRPERAMPPAIHVAGTNGKGSTLAFLKAIIEASGKTAHVYTSPHLVRFAERIQLRGQTISDERLLDVLNRVQDANGDQPGTFFELTTAAAFIAFSETPADFVLLETGLGGRLDATNILPPEAVALSLISRIGIDHQHFLGDGIGAIAREKARGSGGERLLQLERHTRTSNAFAIYVMTLIGVSVASRRQRGGTGIHILIGVVVGFIYVFSAKLMSVSATHAGILPAVAAWTPNVLFGLLGVILYRRAPK